MKIDHIARCRDLAFVDGVRDLESCKGGLTPGLSARKPRRLVRERSAGMIEFIGDALHAVIGLRDRGRRERIGRDDVGAGEEVRQMNLADRVRAAQIEQVVVNV